MKVGKRIKIFQKVGYYEGSLTGLKVPEMFVMDGGRTRGYYAFTPTLVALELLWVELSYVGF